MKKVLILLLAVLLMVTGCAGRKKADNVSVKNVSYPYELRHVNNAVEITLTDDANSASSWTVKALPDDVCQVTRDETAAAGTCRYRVVGVLEGAAQLTFAVTQDNGTEIFTLTVVIDVDSKGRAVATSCRHWEQEGGSVEADGLAYTWAVDESGLLSFYFFNSDDFWTLTGDGGEVCALVTNMTTPSGYQLTARATATGEATFLLVGRNTQKAIQVVIRVDESGNMAIASVQEQ